jgi:hypothetical protein
MKRKCQQQNCGSIWELTVSERKLLKEEEGIIERANTSLGKSCEVPSMKNPHVDISHVGPSTCHGQ